MVQDPGVTKKTEVPAEEEQNELNMGPWNIPKYHMRKKINHQGKGIIKRNENAMHQGVSNKSLKKKQGSQQVISTSDTTKVAEQKTTDPEIQTSPEIPQAKAQNVTPKVRNPSGGRNPQINTKSRGITKPGKGVKRRDMSGAIKSISKDSKVNKKETNRVIAVGKENIPSTSCQAGSDEKRKQEEEYMLAYMKTMYQTHGENLLHKFKSAESIRTALGQIDENDKARAEALRIANMGNNSKLNCGRINKSSESEELKEQGDNSPMNKAEEFKPHQPHTSQ